MATPNTLFALINVSDPAALESKLANIAPWVSLKLNSSEWLIVAPAATTSVEVAERLGLSGPGADTGIVLRVENYFGRNYQTVWEWIAAKQGAELGAVTSA